MRALFFHADAGCRVCLFFGLSVCLPELDGRTERVLAAKVLCEMRKRENLLTGRSLGRRSLSGAASHTSSSSAAAAAATGAFAFRS